MKKMYKIEIGQIERDWKGWEGWEEFYEAYEWVEFDNETEYSEEVKRLKKQGYEVYYEDDYLTLFI